MNLGNYFAGDSIPLSVQGLNTTPVATLPDSAPTARIYSGSTLKESVSLPICDRYKLTGYFQKRHRLSSAYSAGTYSIVYDVVISSTTYRKAEWFTVVAGGDADGSVIAAAAVERPEANIILYETESGCLKAGRNPS